MAYGTLAYGGDIFAGTGATANTLTLLGSIAPLGISVAQVSTGWSFTYGATETLASPSFGFSPASGGAVTAQYPASGATPGSLSATVPHTAFAVGAVWVWMLDAKGRRFQIGQLSAS